MRKKRVLVTAGNSLLGQSFNELFSKEYEIYNLYHSGNINKKGWVKCDITDSETVSATSKFIGNIDIILHYAAQTTVWRSRQDKSLDAMTNIVGTLNMITLAEQCNASQFIFSSSESVYGDAISPIETSKKNPITPYGISKSTCEKYINYCQDNSTIDFTIFRPSYVIGKGMTRNPIVDIISQINQKEIKLFQSDQSIFNFISADEVNKMVAKLIYGEININDINIVNRDNIKLIEIIFFVSKITGIDYKVSSSDDVIQKNILSTKYPQFSNFTKKDVLDIIKQIIIDERG